MNSRLAVFAILVMFAVGAFAQNTITATGGPKGFIGTAHFGPPPFAIRPITGAPYSGEEVNETVQTLVDGTHITRTMPATKVFRDSLGRTRTERQMFSGPIGLGHNVPDAPIIIEIIDPAAQSRYTLDTQNRVAHRQELAASRPDTIGATSGRGWVGGVGGSTATGILTLGGGVFGNGQVAAPTATGQMTDAARPQTTTEKLATRTIEGLLVEGTRYTTTWPVGAQGNDRPITSTNETWMSPELKVVILSEGRDPRSGEQTQKLINISRSEPDPSLFEPPPDYTVVDEKAEFTIKWGSQQQ